MKRDLSCFAIERVQALARANPERAQAVFPGPLNIIGAQAGAIVSDLSGLGIESVEPGATGKPQHPGVILRNVNDLARTASSLQLIVGELFGRRIELVEEPVGCYPKHARPVLE